MPTTTNTPIHGTDYVAIDSDKHLLHVKTKDFVMDDQDDFRTTTASLPDGGMYFTTFLREDGHKHHAFALHNVKRVEYTNDRKIKVITEAGAVTIDLFPADGVTL